MLKRKKKILVFLVLLVVLLAASVPLLIVGSMKKNKAKDSFIKENYLKIQEGIKNSENFENEKESLELNLNFKINKNKVEEEIYIFSNDNSVYGIKSLNSNIVEEIYIYIPYFTILFLLTLFFIPIFIILSCEIMKVPDDDEEFKMKLHTIAEDTAKNGMKINEDVELENISVECKKIDKNQSLVIVSSENTKVRVLADSEGNVISRERISLYKLWNCINGWVFFFLSLVISDLIFILFI